MRVCVCVFFFLLFVLLDFFSLLKLMIQNIKKHIAVLCFLHYKFNFCWFWFFFPVSDCCFVACFLLDELNGNPYKLCVVYSKKCGKLPWELLKAHPGSTCATRGGYSSASQSAHAEAPEGLSGTRIGQSGYFEKEKCSFKGKRNPQTVEY